jgi:FAD linked oxidases, C-terminal domain
MVDLPSTAAGILFISPDGLERALALTARCHALLAGVGSLDEVHAHGIGALKAPWLRLARTEAERALFARIRSALDPSGTLNPNVLPRLSVTGHLRQAGRRRMRARTAGPLDRDQVILNDVHDSAA